MKFIVKSTTLLKSLENVHGIVERRKSNLILSNLRISVADDNVIINATDMEIDIVEKIDAQVNQPGSTTVNAHYLFETIKKLPPKEDVNIEYGDNLMYLTCGDFSATLNTLPVTDFPSIYVDEMPISFVIATSALQSLFEKTRFSVSNDENRFYLTGIYLHTTLNNNNEKVLRAVSTDSHRLSLSDYPCEETLNIEKGVILPKKTVDEVYKLLGKLNEEKVQISLSGTRISFKFKNLVLTSKLIDGDYPNYSTVIPVNNDKVVSFSRGNIIKAIDLVSIYSDIQKSIKISINNNKATLEVNTNSVAGSAKQSIDVESTLEEMIVTINYVYLNDIFTNIKDETAEMYFSNPTSPILIKAKNNNQELFVVMPMKVSA